MKERISGRERQLDPERGSAADFRIEVYRTVVELNNAKRGCETDSASALARREKQLEYSLCVVRRNSFACIAH